MKVETYKIKSWKEKETGLLIAENEDWILTKHIPIDYVVDGYKLYQKKFIKKRITTSQENQIARVVSLKNIETAIPADFKFENILNTLQWCENTFGLFEFQDKDQSASYFGKINTIHDDMLTIDLIEDSGLIAPEYDYEFSIENIRSITFDTDYFQSIRLLMLDEVEKPLSIA